MSCSCNCCTAMLSRCAPDGTEVVVILDAAAQTSTYYNTDGSPYLGDTAALVSCSGGGGAVTFLEYVPYDPAVHVDGTIAGTGTAADPFQIPIFMVGDAGDCCPTDLAFDPATGDLTLTYIDANGDTQTLVTPIPFPEIVFTSDGDTVGVTVNNHTVNVVVTSTDAGNVASIGTDGGTYISCDDINGCITAVYVPYDPAVHDSGAIEGDGSPADPYQIPLPPPGTTNVYVYAPYDPAIHGTGAIVGDGTAADPYQIPLPASLCDMLAALPAATEETLLTDEILVIQADGTCVRKTLPAGVAAPDLVVTTDGDNSGVTQSGGGDHIVDIVVTDPDPSNIASVGPNGGTLVTCDDINGCVNFEYFVFDPAVHDPGVIEGDGSAGSPYQIPLPSLSVEITDISITNTVVNPDGSTTVTYTITEEDDGDTDPPTHTFDVVFPAAGSIFFTYVTYDPTVHDAGVVEGSGTSADPYQIPLPAPLTCEDVNDCINITYVDYDAAIHDNGVVEGDGTTANPYQIPLPPPGSSDFYVYVPYDPAVHGAGGLIGSGTAVDPYQIPLPDCVCEFEYVPYDPTVHVDGSIVGDGTAAAPFQIPVPDVDLCALINALPDAAVPAPAGTKVIGTDGTDCVLYDAKECPDLCAELAELPAGACPTDATELVTADCETVSVGDVAPSHAFGTCECAPEVLTLAAGPPPALNSMTDVYHEVVGGPYIADANLTDQTLVDPYAEFVIPPGTPGCVQFIQITWGSDNIQLQHDVNMTVVSGDVANPTTMPFDLWAWDGGADPQTVESVVYAVDVTGNSQPTTVRFDWPNAIYDGDGFINDVVMLDVSEACGFDVADLDLGAATTVTTPFSPTPEVVTPSIDMGDCDALYFGVMRHVETGTGAGGPPVPAIWSDPNQTQTEVYDQSSHHSFCQLGTTAGFIDGGSGPVDWTTMSNTGGSNKPHSYGAVPLNCATSGAVGESTPCELDIVNPSCLQEAQLKVTASSTICVTVEPGEVMTTYPIINGVQYTAHGFTIDNTTGTTPVSQCIPTSVTDLVDGLIAPDGTGSVAVSWGVESTTGAGTAATQGCLTLAETLHV